MTPADGDAGADRVGTLGQGQLASHPDYSLHAFSHERPWYRPAETRPWELPGAGTSLARVSTRTYLVLAGLTGLLILAAFAVQLVRS